MLVRIREFIITLSNKIDDILLRPSVKEKRKLDAQRAIKKEIRLSKDLSRSEARQAQMKPGEQIAGLSQTIEAQQSIPSYQPHQQQASIGVWSGVKLGCGMFIVLPIILFLAVFLVLALFAWPSIKKQREKTKQTTEHVSDALSDKEKAILSNADTNGDGKITREEYFAEKERFEKDE
jgi:uncharacterized membrane protein